MPPPIAAITVPEAARLMKLRRVSDDWTSGLSLDVDMARPRAVTRVRDRRTFGPPMGRHWRRGPVNAGIRAVLPARTQQQAPGAVGLDPGVELEVGAGRQVA